MLHSKIPALLTVLATAGQAAAQVPNGNFETWVTANGVQDPLMWITTNAIAASYGSPPTCAQAAPGAQGQWGARVINQPGPDNTVLHGTIVSGQSGTYGFPVEQRPSGLDGRCAYAMSDYNMGQVKVVLSRWDSASGQRITTGNGSLNFTGTAADWQPFHVNINYFNDLEPDTAVVQVTAAAGQVLVTAGAYLQVDDLKFNYTGVGIAEPAGAEGLRVWPTLAHARLELAAERPIAAVAVLDASGRRVAHHAFSGQRGGVPLEGLASGRYLLEVRYRDGGVARRPFVKD